MQFNSINDLEVFIESKCEKAGMQTSNVCLYKNNLQDQINIISFDGPEGSLEPDMKLNELSEVLNAKGLVFKVYELLSIKRWLCQFHYRVPVI